MKFVFYLFHTFCIYFNNRWFRSSSSEQNWYFRKFYCIFLWFGFLLHLCLFARWCPYQFGNYRVLFLSFGYFLDILLELEGLLEGYRGYFARASSGTCFRSYSGCLPFSCLLKVSEKNVVISTIGLALNCGSAIFLASCVIVNNPPNLSGGLCPWL